MTVDHRGPNQTASKCFQNYYHCHESLGVTPQYYCNVRPSVNHWQLRDMVQVHRSQALYVRDEALRRIDVGTAPPLQRGQPRTLASVAALDYRPRCFHLADGLVVSGGLMESSSRVRQDSIADLAKGSCATRAKLQTAYPARARGILLLHNLEGDAPHTFALGDLINNAVTIYRDSLLHYSLYVCNNDANLYVVDILQPALTLNRHINCAVNTLLNNVVRSPACDKVLTVTGDLLLVFLVDPSAAQPHIATIKTSHDSGFGVLFAPHGTVFLVAFQDGSCLVYDLRSTSRALHLFESTRPGHQNGAFRCCKFLQTGVNDVLAVSEHVGRVHLVDLRRCLSEPNSMAGHQVIVVPLALDQYARQRANGALEHEVAVYDDTDSDFPAPLVYDYSFLVEHPDLFKNYHFEATKCSEHSGTRFGAAANQVNGEMNVSGIDWMGERLLVGSEDGGILAWDMNSRGRKGNGVYAYM